MWNNTNQGPLHPWLKAFLETHYGSGPSRQCANDERREAHMCVRISAEYTRGGVVFRAHPNYRKKGPWTEWTISGSFLRTNLLIRESKLGVILD
jgi:hypothetical protein